MEIFCQKDSTVPRGMLTNSFSVTSSSYKSLTNINVLMNFKEYILFRTIPYKEDYSLQGRPSIPQDSPSLLWCWNRCSSCKVDIIMTKPSSLNIMYRSVYPSGSLLATLKRFFTYACSVTPRAPLLLCLSGVKRHGFLREIG